MRLAAMLLWLPPSGRDAALQHYLNFIQVFKLGKQGTFLSNASCLIFLLVRWKSSVFEWFLQAITSVSIGLYDQCNILYFSGTRWVSRWQYWIPAQTQFTVFIFYTSDFCVFSSKNEWKQINLFTNIVNLSTMTVGEKQLWTVFINILSNTYSYFFSSFFFFQNINFIQICMHGRLWSQRWRTISLLANSDPAFLKCLPSCSPQSPVSS